MLNGLRATAWLGIEEAKMKKLLVSTAIVALTFAGMCAVTSAQEKRTWQLYGLFCNDVKSLNTVIENIDKMSWGAIDMVNKEKQTCTYYPPEKPVRVVADKLNMLETRPDRTGKMYLYEVNVVGYIFFPLLRPIEPITQYFYTQTVLSGTVEREAL